MAQITILTCGLLSAAAGAVLAFFMTTIFDTNLFICMIAASLGAVIGSLLGWTILRHFLGEFSEPFSDSADHIRPNH